MSKNVLIILICFLCLFNIKIEVFAQRTKSSQKAGEQRNAEKGLKDNQYYIYYLDSTITNLGSDEDKAKYKLIVQKYLLSKFLYMKFLFSESYKEIRNTQKMLIELYIKIINEETIRTKALLNKFAPYVIHSKDAHSRLHLNLGYRNTKHSSIDKGMADHYKPTLYSMRLYKYIRSLKKLKESKRYAFLSIIWIYLKPGEKLREMVYDDKLDKYRIIDYEEIKKRIEKLDFPGKKDEFILQHMDSYYKIKESISQFEMIWNNPRLEENEDFQEYLKMSY